ncbi:hypothetical protein NQ314_014503 [Rhamnusium bicolor]|uniref:Uncharacterized protein n=1 Tax=Rhamnusium bicolor TaxID=1586634 RepID=A0AAV8X1K7_9CUCU|nr:hypothetical protein NQ314_014503 [Rhamnusium bicolor]
MPDERGQKRSLEECEETVNKKHDHDDGLNKEVVSEEKDRLINKEKKLDYKINVTTETVKYFNGVEIANLSKRQMKKYKKSLKWLDIKKEKRAKERIKTKEKKIIRKIK